MTNEEQHHTVELKDSYLGYALKCGLYGLFGMGFWLAVAEGIGPEKGELFRWLAIIVVLFYGLRGIGYIRRWEKVREGVAISARIFGHDT